MSQHQLRAARRLPRADTLKKLVEDAPDVIFRVRLKPNPCLQYLNPAVFDLTGYRCEEWYRDPGLLMRIVVPEERKQLISALRNRKLPASTITLHFVHADGHEVTAEAHCATVKDRRGDVVAVQGIVRQVTSAQPQPKEAVRAPGEIEPAAASALEHAGIWVDTDRMQVKLQGSMVPLTLKEVLLLAYLIRHRGEMLRRDRVLDDVWGPGYSTRTRTLDVHVCRLRRKLPPLASSLVTVGHFGYTLTPSPDR